MQALSAIGSSLGQAASTVGSGIGQAGQGIGDFASSVGKRIGQDTGITDLISGDKDSTSLGQTQQQQQSNKPKVHLGRSQYGQIEPPNLLEELLTMQQNNQNKF